MTKYVTILLLVLPVLLAQAQKKQSKFFLSEEEITTYSSEKEFYEAIIKIKVGEAKKRDFFTVINKLMKEQGSSFEERLSNLDSALKVFEMLVIRKGYSPGAPEKFRKTYQNKLYEIENALAVQYKNNGNYAEALNFYLAMRKINRWYTHDLELEEIYRKLGNEKKHQETMNSIQKRMFGFRGFYQAGLPYQSIFTYFKDDSTFRSRINEVIKTIDPDKKVKLIAKAEKEGRQNLKRRPKGKSLKQRFTSRYLTDLKINYIWYEVEGKLDSSLLYLSEAIRVKKLHEQECTAEYYRKARIFAALQQVDSASGYYILAANQQPEDLEYYYEAARYLAFTSGDQKRAGELFNRAAAKSRVFIQNVETLPLEEKKFFIESHKKYIDYLATFINENKQASASIGNLFDLVLAVKGIQLSSTQRLLSYVNNSSDTSLVGLYNEIKNKRNTLASVRSAEQLQRLKNDISELERWLYSNPKIRNISSNDFSWVQLKKDLAPVEKAVEILRFNNLQTGSANYIALVLHPDIDSREPAWTELGPASTLDNKYFKYYHNCIVQRITDTVSYNVYWKNIEKATAGAEKVYIAVDGVYYKINLNTLFHAPSGKYVFDRSDVEVVLSTRDIGLKQSKTKGEKIREAILIGSPDFDGTHAVADVKVFGNANVARPVRGLSFTYLEGAKREIRNINVLLKSSGVDVKSYTDEHATEAVLKTITQPQVLHIATHGFFYEPSVSGDFLSRSFHTTDPMLNSGLIMAGVAKAKGAGDIETEDGIFTAYEASGMDLSKTELVVLSACETGTGEVQSGEGVFGLQRAFKLAGAHHLMMSLWKVDDEVTQKLMNEFYTYWVGGADLKTSFYMAQASIRKRYPQAYYWGAFVFM